MVPNEAGSMHRGVQHGDSVSAGVGDSSSSLSSTTAQQLAQPRVRGNDVQRRLAPSAGRGTSQKVFCSTRRGTGAISHTAEQADATSLPLALAFSESPLQVLL
jgi:hypothetical protein